LQDLRDLAKEFGVPYQPVIDLDVPILSYRSPGGLLILYPLVFVDWHLAHVLGGVVGLLCFLWMLLVQTPRYCQVPIENLLLPLALAASSSAFIESSYFGALSALIGTLMVAVVSKPERPASGIALASATALKLYPGLLFVPFLARSHKTLKIAALFFAVLSVLGMVIFELSATETLSLFLQGPRGWLTFRANTSLVAALLGESAPSWLFAAVVLGGIAWMWWFSRHKPLMQSLALAVPVALIVSPISWVHYDVALVPIVIWLFTRSGFGLGRVASTAWLVIELVGSQFDEFNAYHALPVVLLGARIFVAVAIALAPPRLWETSNESDLGKSLVDLS
jgi:hypothetical protein